MSLKRCTSSGLLNPWENTRCRLPSRAWPKQEASLYPYFWNMSTRSCVISPSLSTGQATSSINMLVPAHTHELTAFPDLCFQHQVYPCASRHLGVHATVLCGTRLPRAHSNCLTGQDSTAQGSTAQQSTAQQRPWYSNCYRASRASLHCSKRKQP